MKKTVLFIIILLGSFTIFSNDDDYNPENDWREKLNYLKKDLVDMKKWETAPEVYIIVQNQIRLREKEIDIVEKLLASSKKNYNEAEIDVDLINYEMDINYNRMESIKETDARIKELLDQIIVKKQNILVLKREEATLNKKLEAIKKQKRIEELKKELEDLE